MYYHAGFTADGCSSKSISKSLSYVYFRLFGYFPFSEDVDANVNLLSRF
jgi:hypothetical protein